MRLFPLLMAAIVMAVLYFWIVHPDDVAEAAPPEAEAATGSAEADAQVYDPVKVVVFTSIKRPVQSAIVLRGRTEAHRNVRVRAETAGLVVNEPMRAGARVKVGDTLCKLEMGSRAAQLGQARAALLQAEADNNAAQKLAERGYASETTAIARRAALEAAHAAVDQVELDIRRLDMSAPFDGVLETDTAELGALLKSGDECAALISLDPIEIVGFVPEIDVDKVSVGMAATARLVSGRDVTGIVTFVSRSADPNTRTFRVEIAAANPDEAIRDGLTAEIAIPLAGQRAHLIPQAALTLNNAGAMGVRTTEDGKARFLPVTVLRDELRGVWVLGLPDSVDVIIVGQEYVSEGRAIVPTYTEWDVKG
jgi:multidrug efflux system membrane fusion protein